MDYQTDRELGGAGAPVIAVDGPSGAGKSTVSRSIALEFGFRYLDTGATYRALTWWLLQRGVDPQDSATITALIEDPAGLPVVEVGTDPHAPTISVDGADGERAIRTPEVTAAVSAVSAVPGVRAHLVEFQRSLIGTGGIVVEGRDIGTVVAPGADAKIYLTADADARARRRLREMQQTGLADGDSATTGAAEALDAINRRDHLDSTRATAPLTKAADAYEVDATAHELPEVVSIVTEIVRRRLSARSDGTGGGADKESDPPRSDGRKRPDVRLPADITASSDGHSADADALSPHGGSRNPVVLP